VTYCPNGGTGSNIVDSVNSGTYYSIRQNPFSRTGYTFDGWNTNANGTGVNYSPGQVICLTSSLTLYAKWKASPTLTVTYYPNGGIGSTIVDNVNNGTYYTVRQNPGYTRNNYSFDGLNTKADGLGVNYSPGQVYYLSNSLTLYAKWKQAPQTIIVYVPNGGIGDTNIVNVGLNTYYSIADQGYTWPGYTQIGWNTLPNGVGTPYLNGHVIYATGPIILYAQWIPGPTNQFTITYYPNGGNGSIREVKVNANSYYTIENLGYARSGYFFDCWNTRADGSGINYQNGQNIYVTGNISLYAKWEPWI
jgi:uncharacterized repeat protein (TIGR02543 family)